MDVHSAETSFDLIQGEIHQLHSMKVTTACENNPNGCTADFSKPVKAYVTIWGCDIFKTWAWTRLVA